MTGGRVGLGARTADMGGEAMSRRLALYLSTTLLVGSPAFAPVWGGVIPAPPVGSAPAPVAPNPALDPTGTVPTSPPEAAPPPANRLQEIVVTAQRRSENLQNVPIAVTAVTSNQLAQAGVHDLTDLKVAVPTLNLTTSNGYLNTSLRGVGSNADGPGIENPVALYIDGVYYGSPVADLLTLNNVAQVEVLKGPQGTLFGRNATGGLIQVTTRSPTVTPHGDFGVSYGNYDTVSTSGYLTGGYEHAATDVAVSFTHQGEGYGHDLFNGKDVYQAGGDFAIRSKTILTPLSGTKITIIGDYEKSHLKDNELEPLPGTIDGFAPQLGPTPNYGYNIDTDYIDHTDTWSGGASIRIDQRLGSYSLASTTAYRRDRTDIDFDYDGTPQTIETFFTKQRDLAFTQELQLTSPAGKRLTWVVGAFYYEGSAGYDPLLIFANDQGVNVNLRSFQDINSVAGYGQATYKVFSHTNLTFGARFTTESRSLEGTQNVFIIPIATQLPPSSPPLGLTHPNFDNFQGCQLSAPQGGVNVTIGSCSGNQLPLASKILANLQGDYTLDLGGGSLDLNANVYYNNGFYTESDNIIHQPAYAELGVSARWLAPDGHTSIGIFGKNLNDERVLNFASTIPNGTHTGYYQAPRTYGVSVGYKF